ncbi:MAG: toll/interleukin-1 receptor domain-containing protein [Rhodoglobus sp.]
MTNNRERSSGTRTPEANSSQPQPSLQPSSPSDGEITIFLSYCRADDAVYNMVRPFKQMLSHFVYAKSGRKIKAFLDQDNIEWGELWQDRLESEILGASVFIPLLSASYLDSEMCRMEFNRFQTNASALDVKELLLPVLLINAPAIFNENSTDDVVREAAARQWEIVEEAVLSDLGSSAWKTTMAHLADRFVKSYEVAEAKLADLESGDLPLSASDDEEKDDEEDEDDPGLVELMASLEVGISGLTTTSQDMAPAIEALGTAAASAGKLSAKPTSQEVLAWSVRSARAFRGPADRVSELGERMFNTTKAVDLDMQRVRRIAIRLLSVSPSLAVNYNQMISQLSGLDEVGTQLNSLLEILRPAEAFSVPLRKSLRPMRRGLTRVTDSLRLIENWQPIDVVPTVR